MKKFFNYGIFFFVFFFLANTVVLSQRFPPPRPVAPPIYRPPVVRPTSPSGAPVINRPPKTQPRTQSTNPNNRTTAGRPTTSGNTSTRTVVIPPPNSPQLTLARTQVNAKLAQLRTSVRARLRSNTALTSGAVPVPNNRGGGGGGNSGSGKPPTGGSGPENSLSKTFNNAASVTNAQWLSQTHASVRSKIPAHLGEPKRNNTLSTGVGLRWFDAKGNSIRIYRGNPKARYEHQRRPYVRISSKGPAIGSDGKPRNDAKDSPEVHIPLEDWLQWKTWDQP